jgi:hypothetical protein
MTVAELIEMLSKLPQDAEVMVDSDYHYFHCEGATMHEDGRVFIEIG